jgi:3-oxoacyl-[acyl-carrier protein] reductase
VEYTFLFSTLLALTIHVNRGTTDVGQNILKAAIDLFTDGDSSQLKIHILIHNAAVTEFGTIETQTLQGIDDLFNVNGSSSLTSSPA